VTLLRLGTILLFAGTALSGCGGGGAADLTQPPNKPAFASLTLAPATVALTVGSAAQLTAVAQDTSGNPLSGLPAPNYTSSDPAVATVDAAGLVTGTALGTATITATLSADGTSRSATATAAVTDPATPGAATVLTPGTSFSPPSVAITAGGTVTWQFSGAVHNVTFGANQPAGGNIPDQVVGNAASRTFATPGTYTYECTNHSGMTGTVVVQGTTAPVFTSLTLAPTTPAIAVGDTVRLTATPLDQFGNALSGAPAPTFSSSRTGVATVNSTGLVTGVAAGTATITASLTAGGVTQTATATVTVNSQSGGTTVTTPNRTFSPPSVTVAAGGKVTWQFSGAVHNVTFTGAAPTGGNIPDQAVGNAVSRTFPTPGTYSYQCTRHSGMTGNVVVQGSQAPVLTSVTVTPNSPSITVGGTVQLTATPLDQFGNALSGAPAPSFSSGSPGVATVNGTGLVTSVTAGTATITASVTSGSITKTATSVVTVTPQSGGTTVTTPNLTFAPPSVTIAAGGTVTWQFSGALHNVTFTGTAPTGGNISDQAVGNAVSRTFATAGTYTYECTNHNNMTGTVVVQGGAAPVFTSLSVTPATPSIAVGATVQLTATPLDQNGSAMTGLPAPSFSSGSPGVATVSSTGLVTGVAAGSATITASVTAGSITKTATSLVTVTPQSGGTTVTTPNRTFSPPTVTVAVGGVVTWQFTDGTHNVTFGANRPAGGNIPDQAAGNAVSRTFATAGTYTYECTNHNNMTGAVVVQGGAPPVFTSLDLTPTAPAINVATTVQLTATPLDQNGSAMTGLPAPSFSSGTAGVATVDGTGLVTGVAAGTDTITASLTAGGVTRTAAATVTVNSTGGVTVTADVVVRATLSGNFSPADVEIAPGSTVAWEFVDGTLDVTFKNAAPPGGNILDAPPGSTATRTFPNPGDYEYYSSNHEGMKGRIRVR
jgi:plastocyanin